MAEVSPEKVYEKTLKVRSQQKNDTRANWDKATNFAPLKGEITVYSDENKIKIGDGSTKVTALPYLDAQNAEAMHCYTTSGTAGTWTVSIPGITELKEGLTIKIRLGVAYNSTTNTLNVNGLGAKTVYFRYGSKLTSHYTTNAILALTYTTNAIASGTDKTGWIVESNYDSTNTQVLRAYNTRLKPKTALNPYHLCFVNKDNYLIPTNSVAGTATGKTLTTEEFDLTQPIFYYNSNTAITASSQVGTGSLYMMYTSVDLRYSFNTGTTLTANKEVYLVVMKTNDYFKLYTDPITQTLPTTKTNLCYVYLGFAINTYQIELALEHPIYTFNSGTKEPLFSIYAKKGYSTTSATTGITAALAATPTFTGTAHHHTYSKAKFSFNTSTRDLTLGFDSTNSGDTMATGSVSKPNVTITDNGHTHTLQ